MDEIKHGTIQQLQEGPCGDGAACIRKPELLLAAHTPWHGLALGASQALPSVPGQCQRQQTPQPGEDQEQRGQGTANTE